MINVAVAGYGWWGKHIVRRLAGNDRLKVRFVAEPDAGQNAEIEAAGCRRIAELILTRSGQPASVERYEWTDTVVANLDAFAATIEGEGAYPFTAEEIAHNIEVPEAVAAAAQCGETVHMAS